MKNLLIILVICLNIGKIIGQERKLNIKQFLFINSSELDYYFQISEKPVTNLDYLTYLSWIYFVYVDYPDVLINAIPTLNIDSLSSNQKAEININSARFQKLIEVSNSEDVNRLFDYRYINYPVVGLSKSQIYRFSKWLTDRYNENKLIEKNIFEMDPYQVGENNFSTESYLQGQYEGLVRRELIDETTKKLRHVNWSDNYFIPTFRLPTEKELSILGLGIEMKEYDSFIFLRRWTKYYIKYSNKGLTIKGDFMSILKDFKIKDMEPIKSQVKLTEYAINSDSIDKQNKLSDIYYKLGQSIINKKFLPNVPKDSLGHYPLQIICDKGKEPYYATPPMSNEYKHLATFRLVMNEIK
jgi:hypothetical protein